MPTPVSLGPAPIATFLDATGAPLAGGFVYTYAAGTNTPQPTYTDDTGNTQNANPVVLDSAGRAQIWFSGLAYKIVVADSSNSQQYTVDGFSIGVFANGNNAFSGTNTFAGTSTFNGAVNINNGGSLSGTFTGNPNFSGSPTFTGTVVANRFQSTVATGTAPLIIASTTVVPNLNVEVVNGVSFPVGGATGDVPVISAPNVITYETPAAVLAAGGYKVEYLSAVQVTVANTLVKTTVYTFTLPANEMGGTYRVLRIYMAGIRSSNGADGSRLTLTLDIDGATVLTSVDDVGFTSTHLPFTFQVQLITSLIGGSGKLSVPGGNYSYLSDGVPTTVFIGLVGGDANGAISYDTTASHVFTLTAQWGAGVTASEIFTPTTLLVERLGG